MAGLLIFCLKYMYRNKGCLVGIQTLFQVNYIFSTDDGSGVGKISTNCYYSLAPILYHRIYIVSSSPLAGENSSADSVGLVLICGSLQKRLSETLLWGSVEAAGGGTCWVGSSASNPDPSHMDHRGKLLIHLSHSVY